MKLNKKRTRIDGTKEKNRKLTKKEKKRSAKVQALVNQKASEGYESRELTISIAYANLCALVLCGPICVVFIILFFLGHHDFLSFFSWFNYFVCMAALLVSIVLHEGIHGLIWGYLAKNHFQSIEFGLIKEYLTPYCTCLEPLSKIQYIMGAIMPGLVLGILPMVFSLFTGSAAVLFYGILMTIAAGGDFTIILKLIRYREEGRAVLYLDHPTECGLIILERKK
ncbi:MAG: metalloprotease family protein [Clostridiales bacterium]|nr:metalloprotease family protein [Clostridiales bacterium]